MHVPLLVIGPGVAPGTNDSPVSTRRIFHTILDWAGIDATNSLRAKPAHRRRTLEIVAAEAMKPFLDYGWQPQVMAVDGRYKAILAGRVEVYDVVADPGETHDLGADAAHARHARDAERVSDSFARSGDRPREPPNVSDEERRKLASLGYVASTTKPVVRADAPRPRTWRALPDRRRGGVALRARAVRGRRSRCSQPSSRKIRYNLDAALRLGTCYSMLGRERRGAGHVSEGAVDRAAFAGRAPVPRASLRARRGMATAVPMLEQIVAESPDRVAALEGLALVRERQGRFDDAVALLQRIYTLRTPSPAELRHLGELRCRPARRTPPSMHSRRRAPAQGAAFRNDLELGVLYLAANRLDEARDRARSRSAVASRLSDGALQTRAGQRSAARA